MNSEENGGPFRYAFYAVAPHHILPGQ